MKPIVGNVARREQFFPRHDIRKKILDSLNDNQNLLISSPRRVGKTSVLLNLVDEPDEKYYAVFLNTEGCDSSESFFEQILKAILDADNLEGFGKFSKEVRAALKAWGEKVAEFSIAGLGVQLRHEKISYFDQLQHFLNETDLKGKKIILLIDEFPVTLEHIYEKEGPEKASFFLNQNRVLRQKADFQSKIGFVYTGSVGLLNVAKKMKATDRVNDLFEVKVGPLKKSDAYELAGKLFQARMGYSASPEMIAYMLTCVGLFLPFYIQLITKEIYELLESEECALNEAIVDKAFTNLIRNGNIHLQHYKDRLSKIFIAEKLRLVNEILNAVKRSLSGLTSDEILNLAVAANLQDDMTEILDTLTHDGYLIEKDDRYCFYSIILKNWWK